MPDARRRDLSTDVAALVQAADVSVDVLTTNCDFTFTLDGGTSAQIPHPHHLIPVGKKLKLRYLVYALIGDPFDIAYWQDRLPLLEKQGWQVRPLSLAPSFDCLIVDGESVCLIHPMAPAAPAVILRSSEPARQIAQHFERLWESTGTPKPLEPLYEDLLQTSVPATEGSLVVISEASWDNVIRSPSRAPEHLYALTPRRFEELVAELLAREGMRVQLTLPTKDGGRDVLAFYETAAGEHLYLVECKHYTKSRPVGVALIRAIYGVVAEEKATAGLLVTTSRFTRGAISFQQKVRYQLALKD